MRQKSSSSDSALAHFMHGVEGVYCTAVLAISHLQIMYIRKTMRFSFDYVLTRIGPLMESNDCNQAHLLLTVYPPLNCVDLKYRNS